MTCHQDNASDQGTVGRSLLFAEGRDLSSANKLLCIQVHCLSKQVWLWPQNTPGISDEGPV